MRRMLWYLLMMLMSSMLVAQTNWDRIGSGPVIEIGALGSWDGDYLLAPMVLDVEDTLRMWYAGYDSYAEGAIGYAWSLDGITWTKWENNPVLEVGITGSWDAKSVTFPRVMYQDGEYIMYYGGNGNAYPYDRWKVGIARSSDPVNWIKDTNNPVFEGSANGSWDDKFVFPFAIEYDGSEYTLWYNGRQSGGHYQIGRAVSSDGVTNWVRDSGNPLIANGSFGKWDYQELLGSSICYVGDHVEIFYCGTNGSLWKIGLATSSDGNNFTKYAHNPMFSPGSGGTWDDVAVAYPLVVYDSVTETFGMWYVGDDGNHVQIGYATAPVNPTVNIDHQKQTLPESIVLNQNYPNPFNPATNIRYSISANSDVHLIVYDAVGHAVKELVRDHQTSGDYEVRWDGTNGLGEQVATGLYFARLTAGRHTDVIKMLLLR